MAAQGAWELLPALIVEPGLTFFSYTAQFADRVSYLFPELSIQAQLPRGTVRPFLGVGGGGGFVVSGQGETAGTLHAVGETAKALKMLLLAEDPDWVSTEATLGVASINGRPKLILNIDNARDSGADFDPRIFGVARIVP